MRINQTSHKELYVVEGGQGAGYSHQSLQSPSLLKSEPLFPTEPQQGWQVDTLQDLKRIRDELYKLGRLEHEGDYGVQKIIYGHDRDGKVFKISWSIPFALQNAEDTHYQYGLALDFNKEFSRFSETQF